MKWIHENKEWPNFNWHHKSILNMLNDVRNKNNNLASVVSELSSDLQNEVILNNITTDIVKSSAIESEILDIAQARYSVAKRIGIDTNPKFTSNPLVDAVVGMMIDAIQNYDASLTKERLNGWHAALFPTGYSGMHKIEVGAYRTDNDGPMRIVSGPIYKEKVHYVAPSADVLDCEMHEFLNWFNGEKELDPLIKAGVAHLWFVTIHPYVDGNGRIARAITNIELTRSDVNTNRLYSLSGEMEADKKRYYEALEHQQRLTVDLTPWLTYFFETLSKAIGNAEIVIQRTLLKSKLLKVANQHNINQRQSAILNRMLEPNFIGHMNISKYAKLAKCSTNTASLDISELKDIGILIKNERGGRSRSKSYRLINHAELKISHSFDIK